MGQITSSPSPISCVEVPPPSSSALSPILDLSGRYGALELQMPGIGVGDRSEAFTRLILPGPGADEMIRK